MPYTPQQIANYFLDRAEKESRQVDQLKPMKLVYIAYGWVLALTGRRLFVEPILAWKHGPVMRTLYDDFKRFRAAPITVHVTEYDFESGEQVVPTIPQEDEETTMIPRQSLGVIIPSVPTTLHFAIPALSLAGKGMQLWLKARRPKRRSRIAQS